MLAASRASITARRARLTRSLSDVLDVNGVKFTAVDPAFHPQPTASITAFLKAGSNVEPKPGAAHILKNFSFKSTSKRSSLGTVRETELHGGELSASLSREYLALTAEFLRGDEKLFVDILTSFLTSGKFKRHELHEYVLPTVAQDTALALSDSRTQALEAAHALAFRTGLGASLFAQPHNSVTEVDIHSFAQTAFTRENTKFVGTGISAEQLGELLQTSFARNELASGGQSDLAKPAATQYFGGETRVAAHGGPQVVFVGFGISGAGASSPAELATLATYLSPEASVKWSTPARIAEEILPEGTSVEVVYFPYSDATLFGFVVKGTEAASLRKAGQIAVQALRKASKAGAVAEEDLARAAAKAKFKAASRLESRDGLVSALGTKILCRETATIEADLATFDAIKASALHKAAADLTSRRPTYVAVGDLSTLPYPDELGL